MLLLLLLAGSETSTVKFDRYDTETGVDSDRIVADCDKIFVTWEEPADPNMDLIYEATVDVRSIGETKDVVMLTRPKPDWELAENGIDQEEYVLNLNNAEGDNQPTAWAHTRDALEGKLAALAPA